MPKPDYIPVGELRPDDLVDAWGEGAYSEVVDHVEVAEAGGRVRRPPRLPASVTRPTVYPPSKTLPVWNRKRESAR